ncbi:MAG: right-handed parallel beta-helix repeat-containing protein [bacterium]
MSRKAIKVVALAWLGGLLALAGRPASAQTIIATDTTWTAADSPVVLVEDATILEGVTLTIEPGVTVQLASFVSIHVAGQLVAQGTEGSPVLFTGDATGTEPARWGSVVFLDSSVDAEFADVDDYVSGSLVEHCIFEHATRAIQMRGASPYIHWSTFRDNRYTGGGGDTMGGAALFIVEGSAPRVAGCAFTNNSAVGAEGGAIRIDTSSPIIQDNVFTGNTSMYGGALAAYWSLSPIVGNTFEGNEGGFEGGAISLYASQNAFLNNRVVGNQSLFDGGGVHVCVDCFPHANPLMIDNTITDNVALLEGGGGVGAKYIRVLSHNNIHDNVTDGDPNDFSFFNILAEGYPDWIQYPNATNNWWGTTDPAVVAEAIHDGVDEEGYGIVSFEPLLSGPVEAPDTRVTITSLKIRYEVEDDPMPVLLTLYNPGPEREVRLLVLWQLEGTPPAYYRGGLDFPGASDQDDGYRLLLPENSVFFTELIAPGFAPVPGVRDGFWHAALIDVASGERIGDVCTIGVRLGVGGGA